MNVGLISVIIPVYNGEAYLAESIKSVLNQLYTNFELIVVNDGSTDCSLKIVQQFDDPRIKIINKKNTGVSDSRNTAIKYANGEYICFLDADDCYSPYYIQRMYETAVEKCADMIVCSYTPFRDIPGFSKEKATPVFITNSEILAKAGTLTSVCTKMIKTSILHQYEIVFDRNMTFGEDLFFCWKSFLASENVWLINEKLYGYRMAANSATSKCHSEVYEKYKAAFSDLKSFGKTVNKDDEYAMDVFFTTRMPTFILMTVREQCTFRKKRERLLYILNDEVMQGIYGNWHLFVTKINKKEIPFYEKCRKKRVFLLLIVGYKRNIITIMKNKIKGLL